MTVPCNQLKKLLRRILSHSFSRTPTCVWHRQLIATRPAAVQGRVASVCRGGAALVRRAEEEYAVTRGPWARGGGQGPPCWEGQALGITGRGIRSNLESRNWHVQVASCQPCSLWLLPGRPSGSPSLPRRRSSEVVRGSRPGREGSPTTEAAALSLASGLR